MKTPAALSHQNVMGLLVMKFNLIQTKRAPRPARPAPPPRKTPRTGIAISLFIATSSLAGFPALTLQ